MKYITSVWEQDTRKILRTVERHRMGDKDEEVQWRQVTLTEVQWMYRYNTEAKIQLNRHLNNKGQE
jgi:hypothetical protein